jgi:hypothetical protein
VLARQPAAEMRFASRGDPCDQQQGLTHHLFMLPDAPN